METVFRYTLCAVIVGLISFVAGMACQQQEMCRRGMIIAGPHERRGEAEVRLEKDINDRWGKCDSLIYELHVRSYPRQGETNYDTRHLKENCSVRVERQMFAEAAQ